MKGVEICFIMSAGALNYGDEKQTRESENELQGALTSRNLSVHWVRFHERLRVSINLMNTITHVRYRW